MRSRTRAAVAATTILFTAGAVTMAYVSVDDTAAHADTLTAATSEHWIGEFDQADDADELRHYADWVLDQVGVPTNEQARRHPEGDCGIMSAIDMVGLYLTMAEAEQADGLVGQGGLTGSSTSFAVDLIEPVEQSGPWGAMGQRGVEEYPTGVQRIGTPDWTDNGHPPSMSQVRVAVVDTGIDASHPDLNVVDGRNCSGDSRGPDGWGNDPHGHGTHVAGTIGAIASNDVYVEGVAPGVPLLDATVFGESGSASSMTVLMGLNAALELGADVINLSLGGEHTPMRCGGPDPWTNGFCKAAQQAVVVVAAGNDDIDAVHKGPANIEALMTVGAVVDFDGVSGSAEIGQVGCGFEHFDDELAVFSNFGEPADRAGGLDVVAPGGCILSTLPLAQWGHLSGTSMASPHAAGVVASFMARYTDCREPPSVIRAVVKYATRYADSHPDDYSGWPGANPPPMIRYIAEDPPEYGYVDPDSPRDPCIIGTEVPS
jgi:subtilisin family serine protease